MEYTVLENGWYHIPFTVVEGGDTYRDAVVMSPEDYASLTETAFEEMKMSRFRKWKKKLQDMIDNPEEDLFLKPPVRMVGGNG